MGTPGRGQGRRFGSSRQVGFGRLAFEVDFNLGPAYIATSQLDYNGLKPEGQSTGIWTLGGLDPLPSEPWWDQGQDFSFCGPQPPAR